MPFQFTLKQLSLKLKLVYCITENSLRQDSLPDMMVILPRLGHQSLVRVRLLHLPDEASEDKNQGKS
jgi:hypothetical protein